jgi:hypothetical protein
LELGAGAEIGEFFEVGEFIVHEEDIFDVGEGVGDVGDGLYAVVGEDERGQAVEV